MSKHSKAHKASTHHTHKTHKAASHAHSVKTESTNHTAKHATDNSISGTSHSESSTRGNLRAHNENLSVWPKQLFDLMMTPWQGMNKNILPFSNWMKLSNQALLLLKSETRKTAKAYIYTMEIPDAEQGHVSIRMENGMVIVSTKSSSHHKSDAITQMGEALAHSFMLPLYIDVTGISASLKNGTLTITVPKSEKGRIDENRDIEIKA